MLILAMRTDKPESELYLLETDTVIADLRWQAHRKLADTLHRKIDELLTSQNKTLPDVDALVIYQGPGSFTGLRIGMSVANALHYSLGAPIAASSGDAWLTEAASRVKAGRSDPVALPKYGTAPHITQPKR